MNKLIIAFSLLTNMASSMELKGEFISKLTLKQDKKTYEVVILNKAAFYNAEEKLLKCLQKGLKEKVDLEIDPMKLKIISCK
jgi:hypothetical protein